MHPEGCACGSSEFGVTDESGTDGVQLLGGRRHVFVHMGESWRREVWLPNLVKDAKKLGLIVSNDKYLTFGEKSEMFRQSSESIINEIK